MEIIMDWFTQMAEHIDKHWFIVAENNPLSSTPFIIYCCKSLHEAYRFKNQVLDSSGSMWNKQIFVDEFVKFKNKEIVYMGRTHLVFNSINTGCF